MLQHGNAARSFAIKSGVAFGLFGLLRSAGSATFIVSMSFNWHLENKQAFSLVVCPDLSVIASNTTLFESCTVHIGIGSFTSADKRLVVGDTHRKVDQHNFYCSYHNEVYIECLLHPTTLGLCNDTSPQRLKHVKKYINTCIVVCEQGFGLGCVNTCQKLIQCITEG